MTYQPIIRFIEGIDLEPRNLTDEETAGLTDWFGQWLARTPPNERQVTVRSLLKEALPSNSWKPFGIADGLNILYDHNNEQNPLNKVSRHMRFIIIALPEDPIRDSGSSVLGDISQAMLKQTLCIVSSANVDGDGDAPDAFLQCASWDPNARGKNLGMMRFYQRNAEGWVFFGDGFNAFNPDSAGKGPFDGHIGGSMIMKELTQPWVHWYDQSNSHDFENSLGSKRNQPSLCDPHNVLYDPLFTDDGSPFSLLGRAEDLELVVKSSITRWYNTRFAHDFLDVNKNPLPTITTPVRSWIEHILLSRSMNIAASVTASGQVGAETEISGVPTTLFYNNLAFQRSQLLPDVGNFPGASYNIQAGSDYTSALLDLGLGLYYPDFSTEPPQKKLAVNDTEGPFPFPIIEPGFEDYQAVQKLANTAKPVLLPKKAIAAMLMVDFYNPIYSFRRENLMEYIPESATLKSDGITYDVLDQILKNLAGPAAADPESPAAELLGLLNTPEGLWVETFTNRVNTYGQKVANRLTNQNFEERKAAVQEYMILADGRRRLFKGREGDKEDGAGLDEFMLTLPIASKWVPIAQMNEHGEVGVMTTSHAKFFVEKAQKKRVNALARFANRSGGCTAYQRRVTAGACPILLGTQMKMY